VNRLLLQLRSQRDELRQSMTTLTDAVATRAAEDPTDQTRSEFSPAEQANFTDMESRLSALNDRIESLEQSELRSAQVAELGRQVDNAWAANGSPANQTGTVVRVGAEQLTYRTGGEHEFILDVLRSADPTSGHRASALDRLNRHMVEMATEANQDRATLTGDLAGLVPPTFLTEMYAPVLHEARPFADTLNRHELPVSGMSLVIPRSLLGPVVDVQNPQGSALANQDMDTEDVTLPVATIGGYIDVSLQALERGAVPVSLVYEALFRRYGQRVDLQALNGTGANNQVLGALNDPGIGTTTVVGDDWEDILSGLVDAAVIVKQTFAGRATHVVLDSDRWGNWVKRVGTDGRPLFGTQIMGPQNVAGRLDTEGDGTITPVNLTMVIDDNLPQPDVVGVYNRRQLHLFEENGGQPKTITAQQVLGHELKMRLIAYGCIAFTGGLYPESFVAVDGLVGGSS
jgi:HK97 family phage major capsid protein